MITLPSEHPGEERRASLPAAEGGLPPLPQRPAGVQVADRAGARQGQLIPGKKYMMGHTDQSTMARLGPPVCVNQGKNIAFPASSACREIQILWPKFTQPGSRLLAETHNYFCSIEIILGIQTYVRE